MKQLYIFFWLPFRFIFRGRIVAVLYTQNIKKNRIQNYTIQTTMDTPNKQQQQTMQNSITELNAM